MSKKIKNQTESLIPSNELAWFNTLIVLLFPYLMVITPHAITMDATGSKFWVLSVYNILIVSYLLLQKRNDFISYLSQLLTSSFLFKIYLAFVIWTLITFTVAYNVIESWLTFSKISQVFISSLLIGYFISRDKKIILYIAYGMTILLFIDAIQGVMGLIDLAKGKILNVGFIKFIYSNKNIFSAALFIKLPFAVYVLLNGSKNWRYFTWLVVFLTILSVITLKSTTFYLGLTVITILYWTYYYLINGNKGLKNILLSALIIIMAFIVHSSIFALFNASDDSVISNAIEEISTESTTGKARLRNWNWSADMVKNHPLLGVGIGNWKIESVKYDTLRDADQMAYKNHNDFIEITAETGIIGGVLFLLIFGSVFYISYKIIAGKSEKNISCLLLPAFGLIAYATDAFFNFPHDRPEIQSLFALYLGIALSLSLKEKSIKKSTSFLKTTLILGMSFLALPSIYVLYQNYKSLKLQKIIYKKSNLSRKDMNIVSLYNQLPSIPTLAHMGEPLNIQKAKYLTNEGKLNLAMQTLKNETANPYYTTKDYLMANICVRQNKIDSAYVLLKKVIDKKPLYFVANLQLSNLYTADKKLDSSVVLWQKYLEKKSDNPKPYQEIINSFINKEDWNSALIYATQAKKKFQDDHKILELYEKAKKFQMIEPFKDKIKEADAAFMSKDYKKSLELSNNLIQKIPEFTKMLELRAFSNYQLGHYKEVLSDANMIISKSTQVNKAILNLRGLVYIKIGDKLKGCTDLKNAKNLGDKDAANNYKLFCLKTEDSIKNNFLKPKNEIIPSIVPAPKIIKNKK